MILTRRKEALQLVRDMFKEVLVKPENMLIEFEIPDHRWDALIKEISPLIHDGTDRLKLHKGPIQETIRNVTILYSKKQENYARV